MQPIRLIQLMILILSIFKAFSMIVGGEAQPVEIALMRGVMGREMSSEISRVNVSMIADDDFPLHFAPPAKNRLPAELVNTWMTGSLPLTDVYDPTSGEWRAQNGLGESYSFHSNGEYTYAAFLRLQNGLCLTEVSSYRQGKAKASHGTLTLMPQVAKTRTLINCGSKSESVTDGPLETVVLDFQVSALSNGSIELTLVDGENSTRFYRHSIRDYESVTPLTAVFMRPLRGKPGVLA